MSAGISVIIRGKVQGVWYRGSTRQKAQDLGIGGFVENRPDGSVYLEAFGTPEALRQLVDWCWQGPRHAVVEEVASQAIEYRAADDFVIRRH